MRRTSNYLLESMTEPPALDSSKQKRTPEEQSRVLSASPKLRSALMFQDVV